MVAGWKLNPEQGKEDYSLKKGLQQATSGAEFPDLVFMITGIFCCGQYILDGYSQQ